MKSEIATLEENNTQSIIDLPPGKVPISCKWVYKLKYTALGVVETYKDRLVAKGYSQQEILDYTQTFSLMGKMVTVRSVITIAVTQHWPIFQMDVHNTFLQGDLFEEAYMDILQGFASQGGVHKVSKLHKSLYDLKQAPWKCNKN